MTSSQCSRHEDRDRRPRPAGLYFALVMKRRDPRHEIRVVDQNPADATFGFGVVFFDRALSFLEHSDPDSYRDIDRRLRTFIVECDAATWESGGFPRMSEDESRRYCEAAFARDLDGHPLLTNRSLWITFRVVTNRRWHRGNVVLIGDALRTVHFSIGSGTRNALEDAIALHRAFGAKGDDVAAALAEFESTRRPGIERFLDVAARSYGWYERFREKMALEPIELAYDYVMRGGRISDDALAKRSPRSPRPGTDGARPGSSAPRTGSASRVRARSSPPAPSNDRCAR
jgi:2-polyprenyl-6-methoxyphenol hydroxylase-like FAD-dependent oxidoreductase